MRRNLIVAAVLCVVLGAGQLLLGQSWGIALITALVAFVVALGILWIASRFGSPEP